jgi:hypothetical protein
VVNDATNPGKWRKEEDVHSIDTLQAHGSHLINLTELDSSHLPLQILLDSSFTAATGEKDRKDVKLLPGVSAPDTGEGIMPADEYSISICLSHYVYVTSIH